MISFRPTKTFEASPAGVVSAVLAAAETARVLGNLWSD